VTILRSGSGPWFPALVSISSSSTTHCPAGHLLTRTHPMHCTGSFLYSRQTEDPINALACLLSSNAASVIAIKNSSNLIMNEFFEIYDYRAKARYIKEGPPFIQKVSKDRISYLIGLYIF
jgi:hypothetical protein